MKLVSISTRMGAATTFNPNPIDPWIIAPTATESDATASSSASRCIRLS
jgi:hypothetical protein